MPARADRSTRRSYRVALACISLAGCVSLVAEAQAQTPEEETTQPSESRPEQRNCGGLQIGVAARNVLGTIFKRAPRTLLSRMRAGPYCASSQAIGDERDLDNRRVLRYGMVPLPAFTAYANELLERLKGATTLTDVPGSVYLTADTNFQAETSADGNIYISLAVLKNLDSEDELAALLAHELAHVVLGHYESDLFMTVQKQLQVLLAVTSTLRRKIESMDRGGGTGKLAPRDMQQLQRLQLVIELSDKLIHPSWNRRQELEADRFALDLLRALGYSYSGMRTLLGYIKEDEELRNKEAAAQQEEVKDIAQTDLGKQLGAQLKSLMGGLSRKHDDAGVRLKELEVYYTDVYEKNATATKAPAGQWKAVTASVEYKRVMDGYYSVFEAYKLLAQGQARPALAEVSRATAPRGAIAEHAYPQLIMSRALRGAGQPVPANAALIRSIKASEPVFAAHRDYADQLLKTGKRDDAFAAIERAFEVFRKAPNLYPELIGFYTSAGRKDRAQQLLTECTVSLPTIRERCAEAAKN
jgi:predicted Zn-dependent protease